MYEENSSIIFFKQESADKTATTTQSSAMASSTGSVVVDLAAWLAGRVQHKDWRRLVTVREPPPTEGTPYPPRDKHLAFKYLSKWRERVSIKIDTNIHIGRW